VTTWAEWLAEHRTPESIRDRVLELARIGDGDVVLDLGAGTGFLAEGVRARGGDVVAVDPDESCLAQLRARGIDALRGSADAIPLGDASVDAVVTRSVLIYVGDLAACTREIARVLRSAGRFSAFEPLNGESTYLHDVIDWSATGVDVARDDRDWLRGSDPLSRLSADELDDALRAAGLVDVELDVVHENEPWLVTPESADARLDAVGAPGEPSRRERWTVRYGAETAARLVEHLHAQAGTTLPLRWASVFASARKP
jgi:SAM-dependent methyltransferase